MMAMHTFHDGADFAPDPCRIGGSMTPKPNLESIPRIGGVMTREDRIVRRSSRRRGRFRPITSSAIRACRSTSTSCARFASTAAPSSDARRRFRTRRTVKKEWQAAWLLRAITLIDLTTLSGDDTPGNVRRLCAKARHPAPRRSRRRARRRASSSIKVGAVCVYHSLVPTAVEALEGSGIPVAAVSTGFPAGLSPIEQRVEEIHASVAAGAKEIDIVITRAHVLTGNCEALYDEVTPLPRGLRRRAHEGDSRHRRAGDARQRRAREHGRDAGRRRLHQDVDRQGRRERDDSRSAS